MMCNLLEIGRVWLWIDFETICYPTATISLVPHQLGSARLASFRNTFLSLFPVIKCVKIPNRCLEIAKYTKIILELIKTRTCSRKRTFWSALVFRWNSRFLEWEFGISTYRIRTNHPRCLQVCIINQIVRPSRKLLWSLAKLVGHNIEQAWRLADS